MNCILGDITHTPTTGDEYSHFILGNKINVSIAVGIYENIWSITYLEWFVDDNELLDPKSKKAHTWMETSWNKMHLLRNLIYQNNVNIFIMMVLDVRLFAISLIANFKFYSQLWEYLLYPQIMGIYICIWPTTWLK